MVKLVAIGNRFMKDDGIAIEVAEKMADRLSGLHIETVIGETDCQAVLSFNPEDFVFILDASYKGAEPGSIHLFKLEEVLLQPSSSFMQHDMSVIELMKLYGSKFRGYIIGIEIAEVGFGDKISQILKDKLQQICLDVEKLIKEIMLEENNYA